MSVQDVPAEGVDGPGFAVAGAHGGAGATTVAYWLLTAGPGARVLELGPGVAVPYGSLPVVVARLTAAGMGRAESYLAAWPQALPRPWLVVVRDAPLPPPAAAVSRRRALAGWVLGVSEVPYLAALRTVESPVDGLKHRAVGRAARQLWASLGGAPYRPNQGAGST